MATHLNSKGEPCNCGFGRYQTPLGWDIEGSVLDPPSVHPLRPLTELTKLLGEYERMAGEQQGSAVVKAAILKSLADIRKEIGEYSLRNSTLLAKPDAWACPHCNGGGCEHCNWSGRWDTLPTEPMAVEPSSDEDRHHDVQIGNDSPGVATIGA